MFVAILAQDFSNLGNLPPELLFIVIVLFVGERMYKAWQLHRSDGSKDRRTWEERLREDFQQQIDRAIEKSEVHCEEKIESIRYGMQQEIDALKDQLVRALAELSDAKAWEERAWLLRELLLVNGVDYERVNQIWMIRPGLGVAGDSKPPV